MYTATYTATRPEELAAVATDILRCAGEARVFAVRGPMGVGKTTLIHAFLRALGVADRGSSPTFSLVNEYRTTEGEPVYHFDFYRIETVEEVYDIGYEVYFYGGAHCFVEWPEKAEEIMPDQLVDIGLEDRSGTRYIEVRGLEYPRNS